MIDVWSALSRALQLDHILAGLERHLGGLIFPGGPVSGGGKGQRLFPFAIDGQPQGARSAGQGIADQEIRLARFLAGHGPLD